ncbi:MAG: hypothetical protein ACXWX2_05070 [Actinomycetota bacterium]
MPGDERSRTAERCTVHGSSPSVAACDGCGRPLCLACAIPVRGRVLGAECLSTVLGPETHMPEIVEREPDRALRALAWGGHALALAATFLPWSRFGPGSEPFGAWSGDGGWSMLAVAAAVAGTLLPLVRWVARGDQRPWDVVSVVAGALVAGGSLLAIARPPAFTSPWLGPWVALVAGLAAAGALAWALVRSRERDLGSVRS